MVYVGLIVDMIKKYGASIGEFIDKLNEQKIVQLEEVSSQPSNKSRMGLIWRRHRQALVRKCHYLFDIQRNNIANGLGGHFLGKTA
uniref:Uncharacterized protein n=1 Tax=Peromyscus maniculatus bairdii TaxID=230844 RepID=A0A8C8UIB8_PERMB